MGASFTRINYFIKRRTPQAFTLHIIGLISITYNRVPSKWPQEILGSAFMYNKVMSSIGWQLIGGFHTAHPTVHTHMLFSCFFSLTLQQLVIIEQLYKIFVLCHLCVLECFWVVMFLVVQQQQLNKNNNTIIINNNNNGDCENIKGFRLECWEPLFVVRHVGMFPSSSTQNFSFQQVESPINVFTIIIDNILVTLLCYQ